MTPAVQSDAMDLPRSRAPRARVGPALLKGVVIGAAFLAVAVDLGARLLFRSDTLRVRLARAATAATGGLYSVDLEDAHVSVLHRSLTARNVRFFPVESALQGRRKAGQAPGTLVTISCPTVRITWQSLVAMFRGEVALTSATLMEPSFEVVVDRRVPAAPSPAPERMPHERLRDVARSLSADRLVVERGTVVYRETASDGARPGEIRFDRVDAVLRDVTNDAEHQAKTRCTADVHFLLAGAGAMSLALKYDLSAPQLTLEYHGTVKRMEAAAFNDLLVDLEGVRVTAGVLDAATYEFRVVDDVATGRVEVRYHGLRSELVDKVTHGRGLDEKLKTFLNDHFRVRESNPPSPGEEATVVAVRRRRTADVSFLEFLWENLRAGVYETLGL